MKRIPEEEAAADFVEMKEGKYDGRRGAMEQHGDKNGQTLLPTEGRTIDTTYENSAHWSHLCSRQSHSFVQSLLPSHDASQGHDSIVQRRGDRSRHQTSWRGENTTGTHQQAPLAPSPVDIPLLPPKFPSSCPANSTTPAVLTPWRSLFLQQSFQSLHLPALVSWNDS